MMHSKGQTLTACSWCYRVAIVMIAGGWCTALTLSTMPIYWNNWSANEKCEIEDVMAPSYYFFILLPLFFLLWVAMFVIYWKIWREANNQVHRLRKTNFLHGGGPSDWKSIQVSYKQTCTPMAWKVAFSQNIHWYLLLPCTLSQLSITCHHHNKI